ncbi:MAG TPA: hypothetical protein VLF87_03095 [Patescibacteria group bacterium]|nr:hypothetical protein [Patescibacteria group bacterium]
MSENREGWPLIHREPSPVIRVVSTEGEPLEFTHANTWVYTFTRAPEFNHIFYTGFDDSEGTYIFLRNEDEQILHQNLIDAEFPTCVARYPSDTDLELYFTWQSKRLDQELAPPTE